MTASNVAIASSLYVLMAILFYRVMTEMNERMNESRRDSGLKEIRTPRWAVAIESALWPFYVLGLLLYMMKG